jgi:hypothetical protein
VLIQLVLADEPVSTAAVVLGDDSLLTKYLNPHLLAIVSSSGRLYDRSNSSSVEIRLVDGIVGKQVWSRVIPHASAPVHIARSENTVVLTFWNTKVLLLWRKTLVHRCVSLYHVACHFLSPSGRKCCQSPCLRTGFRGWVPLYFPRFGSVSQLALLNQV